MLLKAALQNTHRLQGWKAPYRRYLPAAIIRLDTYEQHEKCEVQLVMLKEWVWKVWSTVTGQCTSRCPAILARLPISVQIVQIHYQLQDDSVWIGILRAVMEP